MISKQDLLRRKEMRDSVLKDVRDFFVSRGYIEVETPLIVKSPDMDPNIDAFEVQLESNNPSKKQSAALITSPEYSMKKLLGAGFERIFTITKVFRNNESLGGLHSPEFTMLEWYGAGDYHDCMQETQDLVNKMLSSTGGWPRIPHRDASFDDFGEPHIDIDRFFVTEYPKEEAALARLTPDGKYAERFEGYVRGMELCNGFSELTDAKEQRIRFVEEQKKRKKLGKTIFPIDEDLINALDQIKKPVFGNALGLDRLIMLKYGIQNIEDIQLFPVSERFD